MKFLHIFKSLFKSQASSYNKPSIITVFCSRVALIIDENRLRRGRLPHQLQLPKKRYLPVLFPVMKRNKQLQTLSPAKLRLRE